MARFAARNRMPPTLTRTGAHLLSRLARKATTKTRRATSERTRRVADVDTDMDADNTNRPRSKGGGPLKSERAQTGAEEARRKSDGPRRGAPRDGAIGAPSRAKSSMAASEVDAKVAAAASAVVEHDIDRKRFTLDLGACPSNSKQAMAYIDYQVSENDASAAAAPRKRVMELYHSEVAVGLRGKGIGKRLARGTFERIAAEVGAGRCDGIRITCSYLSDYMERHASDAHRALLVKACGANEAAADDDDEQSGGDGARKGAAGVGRKQRKRSGARCAR